jgi:hypothetical protein
MFLPPFMNEFENIVGLFTEIGRPILRDWGPDRKQVVYFNLSVAVLQEEFQVREHSLVSSD